MPHDPGGTLTLGSVPGMNSSSTVLLPWLGRRPVNASTLAWTSPSGRAKSSIAHFDVASWRKPCHMKVVTSIEKTGLFGVDTTVLSLFPTHAPTVRAYWPFVRWDPSPVAWVRGLGKLSQEEKDRIVSKNVAELLGL